ncbi:DedA family protein [Novosphingobium sp. Gsoil 351]|uniref:DedA family protein n=1 Tax=Novosphingobium sp. Gsoil 351 TaxID=2675225 RepID=UPI0012B4FCC4|nr:DedA family protein [Novosphingobium sp. Gsoil 351]QGN53309.1 DedA family protein [Novosphingobium sp. Gsoil 351]
MGQWIIELIGRGGYWGIAFLMALENVFPPIPSELIMGVGGLNVARGTMAFWPLLAAGTIGSTLGNYVWFLAGDRLGYARLQPFVRRWGRWLTLEWRDVERAAAFFRRHGEWIVFGLRFSPLLRTMVSLPAGLAHMKHWKFLVFTFAGAAVWNALLIKGGHLLANYGEAVNRWAGPVVLGFLTLAVGGYVLRVLTWKPEG